MSTLAKRTQMLANVERKLINHVDGVRVAIVGLEATLNSPRDKYHGRAGIVTAVMPAPNGSLTALLMILNRKGTHYLNSDTSTRRYRPIAELGFTGRRVFGPPERRAA